MLRLWTVDPSFLDLKGILAQWNESLIIRKVLRGETKGWKKHPAVRDVLLYCSKNSIDFLNNYIEKIYEEGRKRKINFKEKYLEKHQKTLGEVPEKKVISDYRILREKLLKRNPNFLKNWHSDPEKKILFNSSLKLFKLDDIREYST